MNLKTKYYLANSADGYRLLMQLTITIIVYIVLVGVRDVWTVVLVVLDTIAVSVV